MPDVITLTTLLTAAGGGVLVPFVNKILGPGADELGTMIAERARIYRLQNTFNVFRKAKEMANNAGFEPQQVNLKTLLPLMEGASLEEDSKLSDKWAALLANSSDPAKTSIIKPVYAEILSQMTPQEAEILDKVFIAADRDHQFFSKNLVHGEGEHYNHKSTTLDKLVDLSLMRHEFGPGDINMLHEFDAAIDNHLRQRLLVVANPEPDKLHRGVTSGFSKPQKPKMTQVYFSSLGFDFMLACLPPKAQ